MSPRIRTAIYVLLVLGIPSAGWAQLGGVKDKLKRTTPAEPSAGKAAIVDVLITPAVINQYVAAYKARDVELRKMAAENTPTGRYYAAFLQREELTRRYNDFMLKLGPDYRRQQDLLNKASSMDAAVTPEQRQQWMAEANQIPRQFDARGAPLPGVPWDAQRAGQDRLDRVMRQAGGFSDAEWRSVADVIPQVLGIIAYDPDTPIAQISIGRSTGLTPAELAALKARRVDLARLLAIMYKPDDAQLAAEQAAAPKTGMVGYENCLQREMKPVNDWAMAHKTELEVAQKGGDMATLLAFANRQRAAGAAAQQKCLPLLQQKP